MRLPLILLLFFCLTLGVSTVQAQTSLRVNLFGPVPILEQNVTKNQSFELAYSPRVLGREFINSWSPFSSMGGKSFGNARSSVVMLSLKSCFDHDDGNAEAAKAHGFLPNNERWNYWAISIKHTVDQRSESYDRTGDDYVGTMKRSAIGLSFGVGTKTVSYSGFTVDLQASCGVQSFKKTETGIQFDDFYGQPNPANERTTSKSGLFPTVGCSLSVGYTFLK
jgi:hypothetical protein